MGADSGPMARVLSSNIGTADFDEKSALPAVCEACHTPQAEAPSTPTCCPKQRALQDLLGPQVWVLDVKPPQPVDEAPAAAADSKSGQSPAELHSHATR